MPTANVAMKKDWLNVNLFSWLELGYAKIAFDHAAVEAEIKEIRRLLHEDNSQSSPSNNSSNRSSESSNDPDVF